MSRAVCSGCGTVHLSGARFERIAGRLLCIACKFAPPSDPILPPVIAEPAKPYAGLTIASVNIDDEPEPLDALLRGREDTSVIDAVDARNLRRAS